MMVGMKWSVVKRLLEVMKKKKLLSRINRISGEVNGIKKMIEDDTYCNDILIQVIATKKAIKSVLYTSFVCNYFCFIL